MKKMMILLCAMFSIVAQAQLQPMSVGDAKILLKNPSNEISSVLSQTPNEYSFRNLEGDSSVNYLGQVMRQVLIEDLKVNFSSYNRGQMEGNSLRAFENLNSYYSYDFKKDGLNQFIIEAKDASGGNLPIYEGTYYSDIFPKKIDLRSKMAGIDNKLRHGKLLGWNSPVYEGVRVDTDGDNRLTPDELMLSFMTLISENVGSTTNSFTVTYPNGEREEIREAHVTPSGLDLAQLAQKLLHSAVSFSQASGDYLSIDLDPSEKKGLLADNTNLIEERTYTNLQHHWDEAFGYFGASRNYLDYTDIELATNISKDAYSSEDVLTASDELLYASQSYDGGDGEISLQAEKNFALAVNAAKRDLGATLNNVDFTNKIMTHFLRGRQLVQEKPQDYLVYTQAQATLLISEWEKLIAATVIHYINELLNDYEKYGQEGHGFKNLAKHFSELKGFALAFQFNPNSQMAILDFEYFHQLVGDRPTDPMSEDVLSYKADLQAARDLLQKIFLFDNLNVKAW